MFLATDGQESAENVDKSVPGTGFEPVRRLPSRGGVKNLGKRALLYLIVLSSVEISTVSVGALLFRTSVYRAVTGNSVQELCRKPTTEPR